MRRDFFRKNIFTIGGIIIFIIVLFVLLNPFLSNQGTESKELNKLKQENKQLKKDITDLKSEKTFYTDKVEELKLSNHNVTEELSRVYQENDEKSQRLQTAIKNNLVDSLSVFSPEYTKKGDKIAGLIASNIMTQELRGSTSYQVDFTGEFRLKGEIIHNGSGGYSFMLKENLEKIPHTLQQLANGFVSFGIINENELLKIDQFKNLPERGSIEIECVFKNYTYHFVPETDALSFAEFVRIVQ